MDIERHLIMDSANFRPIISRVVAQGDRVYVCGITGDPVGDVTAQTRQVTTSPGTIGWIPSTRRCAPVSRPS